ncbi:MAG: DUF4238 domain-containing protein [Candidatus Doudnabacteria bacterium]|nr:DUF4238 domain-containing protein [Candidatus Doudnabacteria bacterium]
MKIIKKPTVRSHYLPRTYLKHFLLEGQLFMYKKGENFFKKNLTPDERILPVKGEEGLKNVGLENNLYNIEVDTLNADDIEEIFREYGENDYDEIISSIGDLADNTKIPKNIKDKLCLFAAAMLVRTPRFKFDHEDSSTKFQKYFMKRDMERRSVEALKAELKVEFGEEISDSLAKNIKDIFISQEYDLEYPNAYFLKFALKMLNYFADVFHDMNMCILRNRTDRYFITSDAPVVYFVPENKVNFYNNYKCLVSPYTELYFPLTKNLSITLNRGPLKELLMPINRELTDIVNYNISHNSYNFIFSPLKMNSLKEFTETYIPYPFKFNIR